MRRAVRTAAANAYLLTVLIVALISYLVVGALGR